MTDEAPKLKREIPKRIRFIIDCDIEKGEVQVQGPIQQKLMAIKVLTDAINIVAGFQPSVIKPASLSNGHSMKVQ